MIASCVRTLLFCVASCLVAVLDASIASVCFAQPSLIDAHGDEFSVVWRQPIGHRSAAVVATPDQRQIIVATQYRQRTDSKTLPQSVVGGGSVVSFDSRIGRVQWEVLHDYHSKDEVLFHGIRSRPCIDDNRIYYISNRAELICLVVESSENAEPNTESTRKPARVLWKYDFVSELNVYRNDFFRGNPVSAPLVVGDYVYCITGNGCYLEGESNRPDRFFPNPSAPSFVCIHKHSGKLVWKNSDPGKDVVLSWSSPVRLSNEDHDAILFPGGDGRLYLIEPKSGDSIWRYDLNEQSQTAWLAKEIGSRLFCVAPPTIDSEIVYVGGAQTDNRSPTASIHAVSISGRRGDNGIAPVREWKFQSDEFHYTYSSPVVAGDRVFVFSEDNLVLFCLDKATGRLVNSREVPHGRSDIYGAFGYIEPFDLLYVVYDSGIALYSPTDELKAIDAIHCAPNHGGVTSGVSGNPLVVANRMYIPISGELLCIDVSRLTSR